MINFTFKFLLSILSINLINCFNLSIDGPDVITKKDAEIKIKNTLYLKGVQCGLPNDKTYAFAEIGNSELKQNPFNIKQEKTIKHILYEKKAVDFCIQSLLIFPCPKNEINRLTGDSELLSTLILNRIVFCTFDPINFFEFKEPFQGKIL